MIEPITGITTIAGLLMAWQAMRDSREAKTLNAFTDWLRRHDHQQLADKIQRSDETQRAIEHLLAGQHNQVMERLAKIEHLLASCGSAVEDLRPLVQAVNPAAMLSEQALSILRQMNEAEASTFLITGSHLNPLQLVIIDGKKGEIRVQTPRFIKDDLALLCEAKLLRKTRPAPPTYIITRAGAAAEQALGQWATQSDRSGG